MHRKSIFFLGLIGSLCGTFPSLMEISIADLALKNKYQISKRKRSQIKMGHGYASKIKSASSLFSTSFES